MGGGKGKKFLARRAAAEPVDIDIADFLKRFLPAVQIDGNHVKINPADTVGYFFGGQFRAADKGHVS